jgi:hypothetical protein
MSNYWNTDKAPFDEAKEKITPLVVGATDSRFWIQTRGGTLDVYAETDDTKVSPWATRLPRTFLGWVVIRFNCPTGYIGAFLDVQEREDEDTSW